MTWDFSLPSVHSINLSGHKYGGVYPGIGWLLMRKGWLPEEASASSAVFHGVTDGGVKVPSL